MSESTDLRYHPYEHRRYDLVVCGGGLAGTCGAILAARQGLNVALVQDRPVLGGNSSSEIRVAVHGAGTYWPWACETGVICELMDEERFRNPEPVFEASTSSIWDLVLYEWATREPTLELFLSTSVRGVELADAGRIASVRCSQLGSEKEFALAGELFIDATGDGTVAALAGAEWRIGREGRDEFNEPKAPPEPDEVCQGSTIQFRTRDLGRPVPFAAPDWAVSYPDDRTLVWRGHDDPRGGYWWIEIGHPWHIIRDNDAIRQELLRHVLGVFDHLKNHCERREKAANLALDWVGQVPGKRESRRVIGPHILTENDLRARRRFDDRVAYGGWFLDEHVKGGLQAIDEKPEQSAYEYDKKDLQQVPVYSIPLSSLFSRDVGNLLLAGRDISASHIALMSARVMGTCAVIGQAAGAAAAVCHRLGTTPGQLSGEQVGEVQQLLLREDCYIPHLANADPRDLARGATVTATSEATLHLEPPADGPGWLELEFATEQIVPVTAGRVDAVELLLSNRTGGAVELELSLRPRPQDLWDATSAERVGRCRATVEPTDEAGAWVRFEPGAAVRPGLWGVIVEPAPGVFWGQDPTPPPPPGTAVATLRPTGCWRFEGLRGLWRAQVIRIEPESRPFAPASVISGVARPQRWPNLWMSRPDRPMPQSLTLQLATPAEVAEVRLTFDNDLGRGVRSTPPNFTAPQLVRDYAVALRSAGAWRTVLEVAANRHRFRIHRFAAVAADAVRLTVRATGGVPEARVYEVRLYGP